jgi:outer membrane protein OmpA-like peptidoglycan-associated protein
LKIDNQGDIAGQKHMIQEFSAKYHNGHVSWCKKTGELFITQSNYLEPGKVFNPFRKNYFNLRIVIAKQNNGKWEITESFPYNNPAYSIGHPAISPSGDTLIFSSNMPGGLGETDLYLSIRKDGQWGKPVNLGNRINTAGKDEFPYITNNGYLIFASNGRKGMGGLDLYFTKIDDVDIKHFGKPINSEYDDFSMVLLPDEEYGYLASDRPGKGEDDIYKFTFSTYKDNFFKLLVLDSKSKKPIPQAEVVFNDDLDMKTGSEGEVSRKIEDEMSLVLNVKANGYRERVKTIKTGQLKSGEIVQDTLWLDMIMKKNIVLKNIYYDFDSADLLPESINELENLLAFMNENKEVKAILGSHADSRGSKLYNQKLSEKRVKSVVDYMVSKGIDPDRLVAKAYGETVPVNRCLDLVMCTPEELRMNRRTEFIIPEIVKSVSVEQTGKGDYTSGINKPQKGSLKKKDKYAVVVGSFKDLKHAENLMNEVKGAGYDPQIVTGDQKYTVEINYKDLKSASQGLSQLKTKYSDAWIF